MKMINEIMLNQLDTNQNVNNIAMNIRRSDSDGELNNQRARLYIWGTAVVL